MIVPDLNLLVYAFNASAREHGRAVQWWEDLLNSDVFVGIPWVVFLGFCRLMTGRHVLLSPYTPQEVLRLTDAWFTQPNVQLLAATQQTRRLFRDLVDRYHLSGGMITDAAIVAAAIEHRATVHSNDTDFARFNEIRVHDPLRS